MSLTLEHHPEYGMKERQRARPARIRERLWVVYLTFGLVAICVYFMVPEVAGYVIRLLLLVSSLVAIVSGLLVHRPVRPLHWYLFALAVSMAILAAGVYVYYEGVLGVATPFPSLADAFFGSSYLFAASGLIVIQSRTLINDRASFIDPLIITVGASLLAWVFIMKPYAEDLSLTLLERAISISYPLLDILLLAFVVRLLLLPGSRPVAYYLLVAGVMATLAFDVIYAVLVLSGVYELGHPVDALEMLFFVLLGTAALHTSMSRLSDVVLESEVRLTWRRLTLLALASLMAPGVLLLERLRGQSIDVIQISIVSAVLFLLVVARMSGIIQSREQAMRRERILRSTAAALVSATDRAQICRVAIQAMCQILESSSPRSGTTSSGIAIGSIERAVVEMVEPISDLETIGSEIRLDRYSSDVRASLLDGRSALVGSLREGAHRGEYVGASRDGGHALLIPLLVQSRFWGILFVYDLPDLPEEGRNALETLGREIALALESRAIEEELYRREGEERFRSLIQNSSDVVAIVGRDGLISYISPAVERVLGYSPENAIGRQVFSSTMMHPKDMEKARRTFAQLTRVPAATTIVNLRLRHADGKWVHVEAVAKNMLDDPAVEGMVINYRDVTERKDFEERLRHQAFHDPLTSLPNRSLFMDRLQRALLRTKPGNYGKLTAVLFLDLDNFKVLNDSLGHEAGDKILIAVAKRLQSCLRPEDTPARFGGDEFCILLEDLRDQEDAVRVTEQIGWALSKPFMLEERRIFIKASVGIALSSEECNGPSELLRNADVALYRAKADGKAVYRIFDETMSGNATERLNLEDDLRRAIRERQFVVFYQPQFEFLTGRLIGLEALARWQHPERGLLSPDEFLHVAEDTGLVSEMSRQILRDSSLQVTRWKELSLLDESVELSVNISVKQFRTPDRLISDIQWMLDNSGISPQSLVLEITESMIMGDVDVNLLILERLKALGVKIAIDDFGTGYSNLAYLKNFPVDMIKIDRSFVTGLDNNVEERSIVEAVISLGHALKLRVIAEGVETTGQMEELLALGCTQGQGYYFSKPVSQEQITNLFANNDRAPLSRDG